MNYKKLKKSELIEELERQQERMTVQNCTFTRVRWDDKAIEGVNNVSKALLNLTELYNSQNITIESILNIDSVTNK